MNKSVLFCFLVGCVVAATGHSKNEAWKTNTEYLYRVHGRTLAALHDVADHYNGILIRADLKIQPFSKDRLSARIVNAQQANIHVNLPEWSAPIPAEQLHYNPLTLSTKPFEIVLANGIVKELIVSKDVSEWEANLIKSFVSQIQIDAEGYNLHKSRFNQKSAHHELSANFKVMEPTVTGECLTMYNIMPAGEHILQHNPELVPLAQKGDRKIMRILKNKDYSKCKQLIENHIALDIPNQILYGKHGEALTRSATSEIYVSGDIESYVIQSTHTVNKIIISPTMASPQKGMVVSSLNLTLVSLKQAEQAPENIQSPISAGSLLYADVTPTEMFSRRQNQQSFDAQFDFTGEEHLERVDRYTRSMHEDSSEDSHEEYQRKEHTGTQPLLKMTEAPGFPLLQQFARQLKSEMNAAQTVLKIVKEVASAMKDAASLAKENSMSRFSDLVFLLRIMSVEEIKQVSESLYRQYVQEPENILSVLEWRVIRDAVAQTGTGPALLIIKEWIKTKKIQYEEAAEVFAVIPRAVQYPTQEYMRTLYELSTSGEVVEQTMLNDTAILSFTELVRLAYVDHRYAKARFSMKYFHNTESDRSKAEFVKNELIPYLAKKLQKAILEEDSHKTQVYIRALGNVADKAVYQEFKPYLEGEKEISEFQRVFMIMSMDQLAKVHPKTTRNILFKIIVNNGESSQVRVACVYQLMHCYPSKFMFESLATLTHTEPSKQVRAAIKSSIENVAQLKGIEYEELARHAKSAVKLLTPENFGEQYAANELNNFIVKNMPLKYKQTVQTIFNEDSMMPNSFLYSLRLFDDDVSRQFISVSAMVSSIKTLTNVISEQFPVYDRPSESNMERKWADKLATLLNIQMNEPGKLESNVLLNIFGGKRFFTMDNRTVERLPELFRFALTTLQSGKEFRFSKLYIDDEVQITFPTEMSFPFIYSLRRPSLVQIEGRVQLPGELSTDVKLNTEFKFTTAQTTETKIGFVTPYNKKYYVAGYTKNMIFNLPLSVKLNVDLKEERVNIIAAPLNPEKDQKIVHISAWPYTYQDKIVNEAQGSLIARAHILHKRDDETLETIFGKDNGIAFKVHATKEKGHRLDWNAISRSAEKYGFLYPIVALARDADLSHGIWDLSYSAQDSSSPAVIVNFAWKNIRSETESTEEINLESLYPVVGKCQTRQTEFLQRVQSGLKAPVASLFDVTIKFDGKQEPKYVATLALAENLMENKCQALWYLYRSASQEDKKFEMFGSSITKATKAPKLDFIKALRADSNMKTKVQIRFGEEQQKFTEMNVIAKMEKSQERRQALESSPMARLCKYEMENNKYQHPVCANLTDAATWMDRVEIECHHKNFNAAAKNMTFKALSFVQALGYDFLEVDNVEQREQDVLKFYAEINPETYETVNVTIETPMTKSFFKNIYAPEWIRPLLVLSPEYTPVGAYWAKTNRRVQPDSICVLEQDSAVTFNNVTYPVTLGNCYHALLNIDLSHKYQQQQPQQQRPRYGFTVLIRDSKTKNLKDLKIVYSNMDVYQVVDLIPSSKVNEQNHEVYVNDKIISVPQNEAYLVKDNNNQPWARIIRQNDEIIVNFYVDGDMNDVVINYNGARVKVSVDDSYYGQVRGLCGTHSGESWYDFMTPRNNMIQDSTLFAASYALADETCQGPAKEKQRLALNAPVVHRETIYTRVVSEKDVHSQEKHEKHCSTKHQTRYTIEEDGKVICFTTRALPVCSSGCRSDKTMEKTVGVHCLQNTNTVKLYKQQIDKGASPDFSSKAVTKQIKIRVPQHCN